MRKLAYAISAIVCGLTLACARSSEQSTGQPAAAEDVVVSVENNNWQDIDVFAERNGTKYRLGSVSTSKRTDFVLPRELAFTPDLRIRIHPIGSPRDYLSERIVVNPGDLVDVKVANNLPHTSVAVR